MQHRQHLRCQVNDILALFHGDLFADGLAADRQSGNVPQMSSLLLALFIGIVFIIVGELLFKKLQKGFAENF